MKNEKDFKQARMEMKLTSSQFDSEIKHNIVTDYTLFFSRQTTYGESLWLTLVERDKDGNNVKQFDFDDLDPKQVKKMIKGMKKALKAKLAKPQEGWE